MNSLVNLMVLPLHLEKKGFPYSIIALPPIDLLSNEFYLV
jgi:hypothetical protein